MLLCKGVLWSEAGRKRSRVDISWEEEESSRIIMVGTGRERHDEAKDKPFLGEMALVWNTSGVFQPLILYTQVWSLELRYAWILCVAIECQIGLYKGFPHPWCNSGREGQPSPGWVQYECVFVCSLSELCLLAFRCGIRQDSRVGGSMDKYALCNIIPPKVRLTQLYWHLANLWKHGSFSRLGDPSENGEFARWL